MTSAVLEARVVSPVPMVHRSLRVGSVDDPAEVEADAVADRVMRMPSPVVQRCPGGCPGDEELRRQPIEDEDELLDDDLVQAKGTGSSGGAPDAGVAAQIGGARGGGTVLPGSVRSFFEPRFGADFSGVRVHADASATQLAAGMNARAFTVGRDLFFATGEFRPGTTDGDRLLAHELTHTLQQGAVGTVRRIPSGPGVLPAGPTDYRFDTYRLTVEDLMREEVLVRLNAMELDQLTIYLNRTADPSVRKFIIDIIHAREAEVNAVGRRIVSIYNGLPDRLKTPGGACFTVARGRVEEAMKEVTGKSLTEELTAAETKTFNRIWGSLISPRKTWLDIPDNVRGKGAPGAMVFAGLGTFVDEDAIWAGELEPGAVIQTWRRESDAEKVRNGNLPTSYGHSFIFLRYSRAADGSIKGIEIADQGFQSGGVLERSAYGWWIGANITVRGERRFIRPWSLIYPGMVP